MTLRRDPDFLIRAFLAEGQTELPDRAFDAVRLEIHGTRQRVVIGPWRDLRMSNLARIAIGAAAVVLVAVVAFNLTRPGVSGPGAPSPSPSAVSSPSASPSASGTRLHVAGAPCARDLRDQPDLVARSRLQLHGAGGLGQPRHRGHQGQPDGGPVLHRRERRRRTSAGKRWLTRRSRRPRQSRTPCRAWSPSTPLPGR